MFSLRPLAIDSAKLPSKSEQGSFEVRFRKFVNTVFGLTGKYNLRNAHTLIIFILRNAKYISKFGILSKLLIVENMVNCYC